MGAHMFDMFDRSVLHAFGEVVDPWHVTSTLSRTKTWRWATTWATTTYVSPRGCTAAWMWTTKRLVDVPHPDRGHQVRSACPLPLFLKWDDVEQGLRAKAAGFATVSFPRRRRVARVLDR